MHVIDNGKTFVAISFSPSGPEPERMEYAYYYQGKLSDLGSVNLGEGFDNIFYLWQNRFPLDACRNGRLPVIVGWGSRTCDLFDGLLENSGEILTIDRMITYFDVEAYARRKIRNVNVNDRWPEIAAKVANLDKRFVTMNSPDAQACAELMIALDKPSISIVVARALIQFLDVIMADGEITTDEAKGLHSFVDVLVSDQPGLKHLEEELDKILEDDVVTKEESIDLMKTLGKIRKYYQSYVAESEPEKGGDNG